ncbi:MAG: beta-galactosidase, partial [Tannerella sp.]|nr:beta-galactosidase [Tannerella sp.]
MNKKMIIVAVFTLLITVSGCKTIQIEDTPGEQIPVLGWYGIPSEYASKERYKDMAEAGFSIDFPHAHNFASEPDKCFAALDAAQAAGMQLAIMADALLNFSEADRTKLMAHPALHHYHILDEPSTKVFADLAAKVKAVQAIDKQHPCYINLFPNYARVELLGSPTYREHVDSFLKTVPVPFLSFDHYPIHLNNGKRTLNEIYYENIEFIAGEAKKAGMPFWAFALSTAHYDYPAPTLSDLRLQVYTDLAYGAQCIQYFTYWNPPPADNTWKQELAPMTSTGKKTEIYTTVQAMNKEIKSLSKVFLNARVLWTAHTGTIPKGCTELDKSKLPPVIQSLEISGSGALVSLLEKGKDLFVVIVNHDINNDIT